MDQVSSCSNLTKRHIRIKTNMGGLGEDGVICPNFEKAGNDLFDL